MRQIRIIIIFGFLLSLSSNAHALDLSRVKTWAASEILTAADLNGEFNNILNHSLTNNDIDAAAGIVGSKLNLSAPGIIGATTPAAATYTTLTINSTSIFKDKMSFTQTDNNEYIDSLADGYLDFEATTGLRWRINATEQMNLTDGLLAPTTDDDIDLGSTTKEFKDLWIDGTANIDSLVADTADINAGTMDGVQIGGTTATGELLVNDASDDADGLGSQGTSGQYLQSAGAGANPTWVTPLGVLLSTTSFSAAALTGNISITAGKRYFGVFHLDSVSAAMTITLQFDDDTTATAYQWMNNRIAWSATPADSWTGDISDASIRVDVVGASSAEEGVTCDFWIDADTIEFDNVEDTISIKGVCDDGHDGGITQFYGEYQDASTLTSLEFYASTGNFTGNVKLYELN